MKGKSIEDLRSCLLDLNQSVAQRSHTAFLLRTLGTPEAVRILGEALGNKSDSSLMRHELAYILGQIRNPSICNLLTSILDDEEEDVLVRHESAEALGAIGQPESVDILQKHKNSKHPEVAETCLIAIDLINWRQEQENIEKNGIFLSIDPAPAFTGKALDVAFLRNKLIDPNSSLFDRYRAMFSLRDMNSDESALVLVEAFQDTTSALFRHEVAYVLGQMQKPVTIPGLIEVLRKEDEHRMVRHEAAEALGAMGGREVDEVLHEYLHDKEQVVVDSCHVALDTIEYWNKADFETINE